MFQTTTLGNSFCYKQDLKYKFFILNNCKCLQEFEFLLEVLSSHGVHPLLLHPTLWGEEEGGSRTNLQPKTPCATYKNLNFRWEI